MKAIVYHEYGSPDVLRYEDVEKPTVGDGEVLVRVRAAAVNPLDWHFLRGTPYPLRIGSGLGKPKNPRLGGDLAGQVEAVGRNVTQFKPGDEVFGVCPGAFAEYVSVREDRLAPKPFNLSFEEAAAVPIAALTALVGLRDKGRIQQGHKVLVDGASGGVGTFAVQIAKSFGAEVTAVCSTPKMDTARSLGADHVMDYTREDFTQSGQRYDLIFGANAFHSILAYRRALRPGGVYAMAGGGWAQMLQVLLLGPLLSWPGRRKMRFVVAKATRANLALLAQLLETGKIVPVIDRTYPIAGTAEAIRYVEAGHARGKVVITLG